MTDRPPSRPQSPPAINLSLGDIYHILFRNKWKILVISALGVIGSALLPLIKKVPYTSEAKLYIRYVLESSSPTPEANDPRIKTVDTRGESIINTELEILTSLDLAQQVAEAIGPEKISGPGKKDRFTAGTALRRNLTAEVAKNSSVIRLTFQHGNPEIVQPVLEQLIGLYFKKHAEIHAVGAFDDFLAQETDRLRSDLAKTERELARAKTNLGYYASLEDAKKFQGEEISRIRQALFDAEAELAERKAAADELLSVSHAVPDVSTANTMNTVVPLTAEKLAEYKGVLSQLEIWRKKEQDDSQTFTSESAWMSALHEQITKNVTLKEKLEKENPGLIAAGASVSKHAESGQNSKADFSTETARVSALNSKIAVLNGQLERLQKEASSVADAEGAITKLQLQKEIEEGRYKHFVKGLEQARIDEKIGNGKVSNISAIQKPSPPFRDMSKLHKVRMVVAIAGFGLALVLAFILELFVDRSVKHAGEIEGKLGLPLFLTIPWIQDNNSGLSRFRKVLQVGYRNGHRQAPPAPDSAMPSDGAGMAGIHDGFSTDNSKFSLQPFFEALRDRLIGFFEVKNLTHKPKLVAITSCSKGAGVSTFASGLAASLSETGDGNVLLVDMSRQNGAPKHFVEGRLSCGLDDALETEKRNGALVQDNLYVVNESGDGTVVAGERKLSRILPRRFTNLVPKLKASDYDYIIFDMPPISQVSITPRIAKFMDIILLVIESEKTDRDLLKRATTLLGEAEPNLRAVLNKRRTYVPRLLQQEL